MVLEKNQTLPAPSKNLGLGFTSIEQHLPRIQEAQLNPADAQNTRHTPKILGWIELGIINIWTR